MPDYKVLLAYRAFNIISQHCIKIFNDILQKRTIEQRKKKRITKSFSG